MNKLGSNQQKILLLLYAGLALGLSGSPRRYFRILKMTGKEWQRIDRYALHRSIKKLYQSKLIEEKTNKDGTIRLVLSVGGKHKALSFKIDKMNICKPKTWDRKWRVVIFDVPEHLKKLRDALREHLNQFGFLYLQKSVFVHPFPCSDQMEFLIEFYQARPYVRQLLVEKIDNELHLKKKFDLLKY